MLLGINGSFVRHAILIRIYGAEVHSGGFKYFLQFKKGKVKGNMQKEEYNKRYRYRIKWKPDLEVFTDIAVPLSYFQDTLKRQAIVNAGINFILNYQNESGNYYTHDYFYENGLSDYLNEIVGENAISTPQFWNAERVGRDRADQKDYKVKMEVALAFSNKTKLKEFYHNSSWLENGGAPEKATRSAFVSQIDSYLKQSGKYLKSDGKISFQDVKDCLVLVISSSSTQTSYENQTKKAITNKFIQEALTDFLKHQLEVYFIENKLEADKIADQVLINMRSRVKAEVTRQNLKEPYRVQMTLITAFKNLLIAEVKIPI